MFQTTRDEIVSGHFLKKTGGPSAPQGRTVRRSTIESHTRGNLCGQISSETGGPSAVQLPLLPETKLVPGRFRQHTSGPSAPQGRTVCRSNFQPNQRNTVSRRIHKCMVDRPPNRVGPSALRQSAQVFQTLFSNPLPMLVLMHVSRHFEQNSTISSTSAKTPLDSTAIYPTNPVIFHPLITL